MLGASISQFLAVTMLLASLSQGSNQFTSSHGHGPLGSSFGVPGVNATFDYVVIGGGTAGLTLATRLAEQQAGSVAVVEAGTFYEIGNGNLSQVPATDAIYTGKAVDDWQPLIDWGYVTTPQAGAYGERIHYARGKCFGGSSARNYMAYQRGSEASYQKWADAVDDPSYRFAELLPYFTKSIEFAPPDMDLRFANSTPNYDNNRTVVGNGSGPLSVTFPHYAQSFASWVKRGLEAMGISPISGFLSGQLLGQAYVTFTINATTMTRESSETSFMRRGLGYTNYFAYPLTLAKKILFDEQRQATTVIVETEGLTYNLTAAKEIVLTAGVFGSPQLLLVSGIGPAETLQQLGIPVVADRPGVGQNMEDHILFGVSHRVDLLTSSSFSNSTFAAAAAKEFGENAAGMYTNPNTDILGWEKVPSPLRESLSNDTQAVLAAYPADWPELEYIELSAYVGKQEYGGINTQDPRNNYATLYAAIVAPRSRGNLTITSPDTAMPPRINPNWLTDSADVEVAIAGFKRLRQFWQSTEIQPIVVGNEAFPGLQVQTNAEIENTIRSSFSTVFHAACTCAMGRADDPQAVVDNHARVIGVSGIRVVDASAFPVLPPGHPMATVCMTFLSMIYVIGLLRMTQMLWRKRLHAIYQGHAEKFGFIVASHRSILLPEFNYESSIQPWIDAAMSLMTETLVMGSMASVVMY